MFINPHNKRPLVKDSIVVSNELKDEIDSPVLNQNNESNDDEDIVYLITYRDMLQFIVPFVIGLFLLLFISAQIPNKDENIKQNMIEYLNTEGYEKVIQEDMEWNKEDIVIEEVNDSDVARVITKDGEYRFFINYKSSKDIDVVNVQKYKGNPYQDIKN